jgi:hypothetical protein
MAERFTNLLITAVASIASSGGQQLIYQIYWLSNSGKLDLSQPT